MVVVDAHVFYWTRQGMATTQHFQHAVGYVQVGEVERLLERAWREGRDAGRKEIEDDKE